MRIGELELLVESGDILRGIRSKERVHISRKDNERDFLLKDDLDVLCHPIWFCSTDSSIIAHDSSRQVPLLQSLYHPSYKGTGITGYVVKLFVCSRLLPVHAQINLELCNDLYSNIMIHYSRL